MKKLVLYGGSFDPIHHGHLISARVVAERLDADRVVLIPTNIPPHKRTSRLCPAEHRVAMCRLATQGDPLFEVDAWETTQHGPSYSLHTVEKYRSALPQNTRLYFLIGMDALTDLSSWHQVGRLADLCTFVTARRPDAPQFDGVKLAGALTPEQIRNIETHILDTPLIDIRATDIRRRVAAGLSIRYLVPDTVRLHIDSHGLYRETARA